MKDNNFMWLIKSEEETNPDYGKNPRERSIEELIKTSIIILDKHSGPTSHQISQWVGDIFNLKKTSHVGTLDPAVTGVLPILLENSVKAASVLMGLDKEYVGVMHLHKEVPEELLRETILRFIGKIKQRPPVKSAVARKEREREIYFFDILEMEGRDVLFKVGCEAGTYIRKLCVSGDTEIILSNCGIQKIAEFAEHYTDKIGSHEILNSHFTTPSFNNSKLSNEKIIKFQKFKNKRPLLKITTESGIHLKLTPDHEVLVSTERGPIWKRADSLTKNDFVFTPIKLTVKETIPYIVDLMDENIYVSDEKIRKVCIEGFKKRFGSIRETNRKLKIPRHAFTGRNKTGIRIKYIKEACNWTKVKKLISTFKTERGETIRLKNKKVTKDLAYLLGLVASDGCVIFEKKAIRPTRVKFHNIEKNLIENFVRVYNRLFSGSLAKIKDLGNIFEIDVYNPIFANIAYNIGIKSPEKIRDFKLVFSFSENLIKAFLKGYFEGDGNVFFKRLKNRNYFDISIMAGYYLTAKRIYQLLKRLGIKSRIYSRKTTFGKRIYIVRIDSLKDRLKFVKEIKTDHPLKNRYFKRILENFYPIYDQVEEDYYVPLHVKTQIKEILNKHNISIAKLTLGGNFVRVLNSNVPMTRYLLQRVIEKLSSLSIDFDSLKNELDTDFTIEKINSIEIVEGEKYVYDLTVNESHNFIPEGCFVISNCHDIGQILKIGAHMLELRRTKAGNFTEDQTHSLVEVRDAYEFWKEGNEEMLKKILIPIEYGILHVKRVFVKDSAIANICNGSPVYPTGIARIQEGIVRGETVAIYSLKEELVALGISKMTSEEMFERKKGTAIRTDRVFMNKGTYPILT